MCPLIVACYRQHTRENRSRFIGAAGDCHGTSMPRECLRETVNNRRHRMGLTATLSPGLGRRRPSGQSGPMLVQQLTSLQRLWQRKAVRQG